MNWQSFIDAIVTDFHVQPSAIDGEILELRDPVRHSLSDLNRAALDGFLEGSDASHILSALLTGRIPDDHSHSDARSLFDGVTTEIEKHDSLVCGWRDFNSRIDAAEPPFCDVSSEEEAPPEAASAKPAQLRKPSELEVEFCKLQKLRTERKRAIKRKRSLHEKPEKLQDPEQSESIRLEIKQARIERALVERPKINSPGHRKRMTLWGAGR
jgi:hypothetical protein